MPTIRLLSRLVRTPAGLLVASACVAGVLLGAATARPLSASSGGAGQSSSSLPPKISDAAFWSMVNDFSEPGGYFRSDNFLSNENAFQFVIPELMTALPSGGVYLGVGPEQNFTYIVAFRPKLSFIIDIRRQNMIEQLLYKALIEMSIDRADFVSRLFGRDRPQGIDSRSTVRALFEGVSQASRNPKVFQQNLQAVTRKLTREHRFALNDDDLRSLEYVYTAFYQGGPEMTYTFSGGTFGATFFPSYAELMTETDGRGERRSYLATEENFRLLSELEKNNLIVPLVGDFAGEKTIRAIGNYLRGRNATVTAFYTSNVEQYLFQENDAWKKFFANVATLPIEAKSTIIRSISSRAFHLSELPPPAPVRPGPRLSVISDLVEAFQNGKIEAYSDVVDMSK